MTSEVRTERASEGERPREGGVEKRDGLGGRSAGNNIHVCVLDLVLEPFYDF